MALHRPRRSRALPPGLIRRESSPPTSGLLGAEVDPPSARRVYPGGEADLWLIDTVTAPISLARPELTTNSCGPPDRSWTVKFSS